MICKDTSSLHHECATGRFLAEEDSPALHADLDTSSTTAHHDAVGSELGDPELASELTIFSKAETLSRVVRGDVVAAGDTSRAEDAHAGDDEASKHGDASAAEAGVEA